MCIGFRIFFSISVIYQSHRPLVRIISDLERNLAICYVGQTVLVRLGFIIYIIQVALSSLGQVLQFISCRLHCPISFRISFCPLSLFIVSSTACVSYQSLETKSWGLLYRLDYLSLVRLGFTIYIIQFIVSLSLPFILYSLQCFQIRLGLYHLYYIVYNVFSFGQVLQFILYRLHCPSQIRFYNLYYKSYIVLVTSGFTIYIIQFTMSLGLVS